MHIIIREFVCQELSAPPAQRILQFLHGFLSSVNRVHSEAKMLVEIQDRPGLQSIRPPVHETTSSRTHTPYPPHLGGVGWGRRGRAVEVCGWDRQVDVG